MELGVAVAVAVDVGVAVAVDDGVGVGVGVGRLGAGVGDTGLEDVADGDGWASTGEAEGAATGGGSLVTAGALAACERLGAAPPALAVTEAPVVPDGLPDRAAAAGPWGCEPLSASTVMIPVAAIAITTPAAAAIPASASIRGLGGLADCGKPLGRNGPALCATSRR